MTSTPRYLDIKQEVLAVQETISNQDLLPLIQAAYVTRVHNIVDPVETAKTIEKLGSKIEPLLIVDENDHPIITKSGELLVDFRQDIKGDEPLPEEKEQALFCRIVLFILEETNGNIIVSRRSLKKSHPGELELAGGHVVHGDSYLKTAYKELEEELQYNPGPGAITEENRVFKYRNIKPGNGENKGKGTMVSVYQVKVPDQEALTFDPGEIEELISLTPEELVEAITTKSLNGEPYVFASSHAYWYLEYLQDVRGINTETARAAMREAGIMKNGTRIDTFSEVV